MRRRRFSSQIIVQHLPLFFFREFDGGRNPDDSNPPKGYGKNNAKGLQNTSKGKGKGKGLGKNNFVKKTYVAETPQDDDDVDHPELPEDDDGAGDYELPDEDDPEGDPDQDAPGDETDPGEQDDGELSEVIKCLTVTARRLQGMTLGRKFSGGNRTIAQRKAESHCAACGQRGHWQGDSACPHSATSSSSPGKSSKGPGKGKMTGAAHQKPDAKSSSSKKVLSVKHAGGQRLVTFDNIHEDEPVVPPKEPYGTYFTTFMVKSPSFNLHQVLTASLSSFTEFLVLDILMQDPHRRESRATMILESNFPAAARMRMISCFGACSRLP